MEEKTIECIDERIKEAESEVRRLYHEKERISEEIARDIYKYEKSYIKIYVAGTKETNYHQIEKVIGVHDKNWLKFKGATIIKNEESSSVRVGIGYIPIGSIHIIGEDEFRDAFNDYIKKFKITYGFND